MSKVTKRDPALLTPVVPSLPPETLHQIIRSRGLEACGELLTAATPAQLTSVLDLDLWRQPLAGGDEQLDVDRFGEWLEVLADAGAAAAARTLAALDHDLVTAGLSRYVRVFDPGIFEPTAQSDDEPIDRAEAMHEGDALDAGGPMNEGVECEIGGYLVRARRSDAWDAIVTLLAALEEEHGQTFHAVMQRCRDLSNSRPEIDGLDDLLQEPEQHLHDVAIERERRRSQQGYATPGDARAFLQMARQPKQGRPDAPRTASSEVNPIVAAYFRAADEPAESAAPHVSDTPAADVPASREAVMELLTEAGVTLDRPRALLDAADANADAGALTRLRRLMAHVRDADETTFQRRSRELAFLANTLLAGCSVQSRPFTPREASDAAAAICNLGLECWPTTADAPEEAFPSDVWLIEHDLVTIFEIGWSRLYHEVSLFAADQLVATLTDLDCIDRDVQRGLAALRRTLMEQRDAGTPWRAREAAEVLALLDMTAWAAVLGLLDECPVVPAALTAILDRRTTTVSPTAFDFISTAAQIAEVRRFLRKLPAVLTG